MSERKISGLNLPEDFMEEQDRERRVWLISQATPAQLQNSIQIRDVGIRQALARLDKLNIVQKMSALPLPFLVTMESQSPLGKSLIIGGFVAVAVVKGTTDYLKSRSKKDLNFYRDSLKDLKQAQAIKDSLA